MAKSKKPIIQARRFELGRVHHYRDAEALYGKDPASDESAVALGRLEQRRFGLMQRRTDTLAHLRRATATSEPSYLHKPAIYMAHFNGGWNPESLHYMYLAAHKDDCPAGYILSVLLKQLGDVVAKHLSLPIADRRVLYLECLQRSARLGCFRASYDLARYYWELGQVSEEVRMLTRAAEAGYFEAFQVLAGRCRSIGSDAHYVDMDAFLSHAKRLACDVNDTDAAGCLADYLAGAERGALVDRVAALRFHRRSFRNRPTEHSCVVFGDRRWEGRDEVFWGNWLLFLRDDHLMSSERSHFPIVLASNRLRVH